MDDNTHIQINAYTHHSIMRQLLSAKSTATAPMLVLLLIVTVSSAEIPLQIFAKEQNNELRSEIVATQQASKARKLERNCA